MNATQNWVTELTIMQQSALLSAIRGPDGGGTGCVKPIVKWLRRCVLVSAFDRAILTSPTDPRGGAFTGWSYIPAYNASAEDADRWEIRMDEYVGEYIHDQNFLPLHFTSHLLAAIQVLGYKHPNRRIREWWGKTYLRIVKKMHLNPESEKEMDGRLNDDEETWCRRNDA